VIFARDPAGAPSAAACFHCGLPAPLGERFCCAGCEAVAHAIAGQGLGDYYRLRSGPAEKPQPGTPSLAAFDDPVAQSRFVRALEGGMAEADLLVEGMRCAACAWLVERVLLRLPGVREASVNFATRRARVRWERESVNPSAILAAVHAVGYRASPYDPERAARADAGERRVALRRLWLAGFAMMQVMMYALPAYVAGDGDIGADAESLLRWAGLVLTLPVIAYCATPFFRGALRDLRNATLGMDVPVALGLAAAFIASAWSTVTQSGPVYFDSAAMFVFLLLGGRYLEVAARERAGRSLTHLARFVPQTATRLGPVGSSVAESVAAATLRPGDRVLVRPGETLPADGRLESATALVNEALVTGESREVTRVAGSILSGGAVNAGSAIVVRVTRVGAHSMIATIARLMDAALAERPRWERLASRASRIFVAFILASAGAAGLAWMAIDPARAPWIAISVLIVTCPCALSLATPLALTAATGALARFNVVVTRGHAIETLAGVTDFVFDKTGTLTEGRPRLVDVSPVGSMAARDCLLLAAAMGRHSGHPLDRALVEAAGNAPLPEVDAHSATPGEGAEARIAGRRLRIGRAAFAGALHGKPTPVSWLQRTDTIVWLANAQGWLAAFRLRDAPRSEVAASIRHLQRLGMRIHLLTGDDPAVAAPIAAALGIERVESRATPGRKRDYVRALQAKGARVAMIGDGINDAPVLAQADISIAMGGGADLAQVRADAVLLSDSLADLARAVDLARRARAVIRQNLAWALGYNLVVLPLAFAGMVTPFAAAIGMSASSLLVVANALRVRR
jgi:P-type Cu2+ transporter